MDFSHLNLFFASVILHTVIPPTNSAPPYVEFLYPNETISPMQLIDNHGTFLFSRNRTFQAAIRSSQSRPNDFYLSIIHLSSDTVIWSSARQHPIPGHGNISISTNGLALVDDNGYYKWSTPPLAGTTAVLVLAETGNLMLLDKYSVSLWESFSYPSDTIVTGQRLATGTGLISDATDDDGLGVYELLVTDNDAFLKWNQQTYWAMSRDKAAHRMANDRVSFMELNTTGLYLVGSDPSSVIVQLKFEAAAFRVATLEPSGKFVIYNLGEDVWGREFTAPVGDCQLPFFCGQFGVCSSPVETRSLAESCMCPPGFHENAQVNNECVPIDKTYSLPSACNPESNLSSHIFNDANSLKYLPLDDGMDYFSNYFMAPSEVGVSLSLCMDHCSTNCSCLAIFHDNSSGSCYLLENNVGSIIANFTSQIGRLGYIKTIVESSGNHASGKPRYLLVIMLPIMALWFFLFMIVVLARIRQHKRKSYHVRKDSIHRHSDLLELENGMRALGSPTRFKYEEIVAATENFKCQIGSGGFGTVYEGTLPDKSTVAVKKIKQLGARGRNEFYDEISIIGSIHHINLVRLKGFCVQEPQQFLVFEYMDRGSLDKVLFSDDSLLTWQERFHIALGTARGLAYLHSECQPKIIHFDVKPENILLHNNLQVKLSDFGISKLVYPDESLRLSTMRGTLGYLAPEWLNNSPITDKADVYSYGMVLFEIISGQRNWILQTHSSSLQMENNEETKVLSSTEPYARPVYFPLLALDHHEQGRYLELADPRLPDTVTNEDVEKLVRIALCCVQRHPILRPSMASVVHMLTGEIPLDEPQIRSLDYLRFYGQRYAEA